MATKVYQDYYPGRSISMTVRDGFITKVTTWVPGVPGSTETTVADDIVLNTPKGRERRTTTRQPHRP